MYVLNSGVSPACYVGHLTSQGLARPKTCMTGMTITYSPSPKYPSAVLSC